MLKPSPSEPFSRVMVCGLGVLSISHTTKSHTISWDSCNGMFKVKQDTQTVLLPRWCHSLWFHRPDLWIGAWGGATGQTLHLIGYGTDVGVGNHLSITDGQCQTDINDSLLKVCFLPFRRVCVFTNNCLPVDNRKLLSMLCVCVCLALKCILTIL